MHDPHPISVHTLTNRVVPRLGCPYLLLYCYWSPELGPPDPAEWLDGRVYEESELGVTLSVEVFAFFERDEGRLSAQRLDVHVPSNVHFPNHGTHEYLIKHYGYPKYPLPKWMTLESFYEELEEDPGTVMPPPVRFQDPPVHDATRLVEEAVRVAKQAVLDRLGEAASEDASLSLAPRWPFQRNVTWDDQSELLPWDQTPRGYGYPSHPQPFRRLPPLRRHTLRPFFLDIASRTQDPSLAEYLRQLVEGPGVETHVVEPRRANPFRAPQAGVVPPVPLDA